MPFLAYIDLKSKHYNMNTRNIWSSICLVDFLGTYTLEFLTGEEGLDRTEIFDERSLHFDRNFHFITLIQLSWLCVFIHAIKRLYLFI